MNSTIYKSRTINKTRSDTNTLITAYLILTPLILFGTHTFVSSTVAFLIGVLLIVKFDEPLRICFLFYFLPMATIFKIAPETTSLFTIWELVVVALDFYEHSWKRRKKEIAVLFFFIFLVLSELINAELAIVNTIKLICNCYILLIISYGTYGKKVKQLFMSYIIGFIVSSFMFYLDSPFFLISNYTGVKTIRIGEVELSRFAGLYGDPNYYVINIIIALILLAVLYGKNFLNSRLVVGLSLVLFFFVASTNSKSGLLMLGLPVIVYITFLIQKKKYVSTVIFTMVAVIGAVFVFSGSVAVFSDVVGRVLSSKTSLNALTTNRVSIWMDYLSWFNRNPGSCVIGRGLAFTTYNGREAHNTYIDSIYQLGIIGCIMLLYIINIAKGKLPVKTKRCIANYSVIICIVVMYFFLSELQYFDPPFHLALAFIVMKMDFFASEEQKWEVLQVE